MLYTFQIVTILFEQDQQICIIVHKMLRYLCVRLIEIEAVDTPPLQSTLIASCLLNIIKDKDRIRKRLVQWNDVAISRKCKITNFFDRC